MTSFKVYRFRGCDLNRRLSGGHKCFSNSHSKQQGQTLFQCVTTEAECAKSCDPDEQEFFTACNVQPTFTNKPDIFLISAIHPISQYQETVLYQFRLLLNIALRSWLPRLGGWNVKEPGIVGPVDKRAPGISDEWNTSRVPW